MGLEKLKEECYDTNNIFYASVNYKDRMAYAVQEHEHELEGSFF